MHDRTHPTDKQTNPTPYRSHPTDEQTNTMHNKIQTTEKQTNPTPYRSHPTDEQTNTMHNRTHPTDKQTNTMQILNFFFTPLQDCLENITTKVVPFTIMVGYVCKIVFSSLFWVLFDFEFVCFLVGGVMLAIGFM